MSQTANDSASTEEPGWQRSRTQLFRMIMEGRSFSGRERNCCFLNTGKERFATISATSGLDELDDGRCIAITDWDGDGDEDLWVTNRTAPRIRLMRNNAENDHHFIAVKLQGNGTTTNRDAIGARVEVELKSSANEKPLEQRRLVRTLRAGEGFLSQSTKTIHFGLGGATEIEQVSVHWPNGETEYFSSLDADEIHTLTQGVTAVEQLPKREPIELATKQQEIPQETRVARVVMQYRMPMPTIGFASKSGTEFERFGTKRWKLVTLWASWCRPCVKELVDLTTHAGELDDSDVDVLSLCVDRLDEQPKADSEIDALIKSIAYPHAWGHIDETQLLELQELHNQLFFLRRPLPLPTSFLVDPEGRLAVIYRGPVSARQVVADTQPYDGRYAESWLASACLPGSVIKHPRTEQIAKQGQRQALYLNAARLRNAGKMEDAKEQFENLVRLAPQWAPPLRQLARYHLQHHSVRDAMRYAKRAVAADPSDAQGHNTLALIYSEQNNQQKAIQHFQSAIHHDEDFAEPHNNLGSVVAELGDIAGATKHFQQAVQIDDQFAEAYTNLGSGYAAQRQTDAAIQQYRRAIAIDPRYVDAHNNLGSMLATQGKFEQAIRSYRKALELDPKRVDVQRNLERATQLMLRRKTK